VLQDEKAKGISMIFMHYKKARQKAGSGIFLAQEEVIAT
jgi:hypothetical protein